VNTRTRIAAVLLALGAAAGLLWFLAEQPRSQIRLAEGAGPVASKPALEVGREARSIDEPQTTDVARAATSQPQLGEAGKLFRDMNSARDLRKFVEDAKKTPLGTAYAIDVLMNCNGVRIQEELAGVAPGVAPKNLDRTARQEEYQALIHAKCQGFSSDEFELHEYRVLFEVARRDSRYAAVKRLYTKDLKEKPESLTKDLGHVFSSDDPLLIGDAVRRLWQHDEDDRKAGFYFEGRRIDWLNRDTFFMAAKLVECTMADACESPSFLTEAYCANLDFCPVSILELAQYNLSAEEVRRLQDLVAQIVQAARSGQTQKFLQ
jgi:hypothetical protein